MPPPGLDADGAGGGAGGGDEGNWNPIEWDRAAEELTWERLLGLDGSLVFLEHVFWVVSLNTLFILVFAFCPYHMGHFAVLSLGLREHAAASHFEGKCPLLFLFLRRFIIHMIFFLNLSSSLFFVLTIVIRAVNA